MDPNTAEQLSRLLDGDLDAAEEERLRARLAAEPVLAAELESLRRLQQQVRAVAERMEPPDVLDAALEPLGGGVERGPRRIPTAIRWLGIAAGLALGVTVALEVVRRPPAPMTEAGRRVATPAPAPADRQLFELKPLPTQAADEDAPLGAIDRLIATPLAEPELPELAPLDVRGPLPEAEGRGLGAGDQRNEVSPAATPPSASGERDAAKSQRATETFSEPAIRSRAAAAAPPRAAPSGPDEARREVAALQPTAEGRKGSGHLRLVDADGETLAELEVGGVAKPLADLVVKVEKELIVAIEGPVTETTRRSVIGREAAGLADGRYRATLEPSGP